MNRGQARSGTDGEVAAHDVACSVFLARHSAWLDDELTAGERVAHEQHLEECDACARYARVLAGGLDVLREQADVQASPDFEARLQHRLFHLQDEAALAQRRGPATWLAAAAVLALAFTGYRALEARTAIEAGSGAFTSPATAHPHEDVFPNRTELWEPAVVPIALSGTRGMLRTGAYTPVIVPSPQYRPASRDAGYGD